MAGWNSILHTPEYPRSATATLPWARRDRRDQVLRDQGPYRVALAVAQMTQALYMSVTEARST
jgi:hypothetical protein